MRLNIHLRIRVAILLILFFGLNSHAQSRYSVENLKQSSDKELDHFLVKAKKQKKTGAILLIVAPTAAITGLALSNKEAYFYIAFPLLLGSAGLAAVGIPVYAIGSTRVKRVSSVWNSRYNQVSLRIVPCYHYNFQTHNLRAGVGLRLSF